MRSMILAALLCVGTTAAAQNALAVRFEWPASQPDPIPDLRLTETVSGAREAARSANTRAEEARSAAAHAKRRAGVQGALGLKPKRATTDDDTTIALTRGSAGGPQLGSITYPSGATMVGAFGPDVGVYTAAPERRLRHFSGWVWGASTGKPNPRDGVFVWKNGDVFTGSITGDGSASEGLYEEAGGGRRFIGVIDLSGSEFRPVSGYLETRDGKLLAAIFRR
jgi:hypothetical protein